MDTATTQALPAMSRQLIAYLVAERYLVRAKLRSPMGARQSLAMDTALRIVQPWEALLQSGGWSVICSLSKAYQSFLDAPEHTKHSLLSTSPLLSRAKVSPVALSGRPAPWHGGKSYSLLEKADRN